MNSQTLTRKELYNLVWSTPFTALAKKYLISDVGLRKICVKMEIPTPKSGHWERIRFKKPVEIVKLPSSYSGETEITLKLREEGDTSKGMPSAVKVLEKQIENTDSSLLIVPERLTNPDKLIIAAKNSLTEKRGNRLDNGLAWTHRGEINIRVAPENISRALRFMDAFIKIWKKRGHQIYIENNSTYITIEDEKIEINFREKLKRMFRPKTYGVGEESYLTPTGILLFNAVLHYTSVEFLKDGLLPMEKQLHKLIAKLEVAGAKLKAETIERKKYWAERDEKMRIEKEILRIKEKEIEDFKQLLQNSKQWKEAEILRSYLDHIEAKVIKKNDLSEDLKNWLEWARTKADKHDPQIHFPDKSESEIRES